jgi:peptidoglycan hydrolase-like protein with peptidoglycan-binding domain
MFNDSSPYARRTKGRASGRWVRRGSTIVIELAEKSRPERLSYEFETGQPTLSRGSQGSAVKTLQARLQTLGFDPGPVDGIFGSGTDAAVRAFQRARGIQVDGIVGPQTWDTLYASAAPPPPKSSPPPATGSWGRAVHLSVPFYGYQSNDRAGCFRRCTEMAAAVNVRVGGPDVRIQVAVREDTSGRVTIDPAKAREGVAYTDSQLNSGHPVVMGVSYTDASYNVDDITDHFVIVTTRGTDPQRGVYYGFHDPATSHADMGTDQNPANRFYFSAAGGLYRPASSSAPLGSTPYDVSMVRRNI